MFHFPFLSMLSLYALGSTVGVSLLSLIGIFFFFLDARVVRKILLTLVSFSTGALLGDVFLHMVPELSKGGELDTGLMLVVLYGILFSFVVEKVIRWRHCHELPEAHDHHAHEHHEHPAGILSVIGESLHNMIDGIVIAASFLAGIPTGIATTLAVAFHEIPHEIGNVAVLLHSGYSKERAVLLNLFSAATAILGCILVLLLSSSFQALTQIMLPFAAGNLLYIAGSDLIPELHKETGMREGFLQFLAMGAGMACMYALLFLE